MTITIISVGARPKTENATLLHDFLKRLPKQVQLKWQFVRHGNGSPEASKQQEAESILRSIPVKSIVILLDEHGKQLSSPQLAQLIFHKGQDCTLIIGGAYGVTDSVKKRSQMVWSLGKLVYPHQLVRIILAEQIYRAYSIHIGHPYHHE
jgi:23S rRNA (pseudouridine1915-N3)-methyltransferase